VVSVTEWVEHHRTMHKFHGTRGQSVVEFAIIVPIFLALVGATTDVARLYSAWISVNAATRDAAEYLATNPNKDVTAVNAGTIAAGLVSNEMTGYQSFTSVASLTCDAPELQVTYTSDQTAPGASHNYPLGRAFVGTCLPFHTLFSYPFITHDGAWALRVGTTYEVLQNR
jgi:Flp pilus assembly protein TadG